MNNLICTVNGKKKNIKILDGDNLQLDGQVRGYSFLKISDYSYLLKIGNRVYDVIINEHHHDSYTFLIDGHYVETTVRTTLEEKANDLLKLRQKKSHHDLIKAPMPGLVLKLKVKVGDLVEQGDSIIILEAMKMENNLKSPASGRIKDIFVKEGEAIEKDTMLLTIE